MKDPEFADTSAIRPLPEILTRSGTVTVLHRQAARDCPRTGHCALLQGRGVSCEERRGTTHVRHAIQYTQAHTVPHRD